MVTGIRSPGRRALRDADKASADKRRAMQTPSMSIKAMPVEVQEDKEFYELFLESKKYEGKSDSLSKVKFQNALNKMRSRWMHLTSNDEAKAESHKGAPQWLI